MRWMGDVTNMRRIGKMQTVCFRHKRKRSVERGWCNGKVILK
jgi:hypothetical protein